MFNISILTAITPHFLCSSLSHCPIVPPRLSIAEVYPFELPISLTAQAHGKLHRPLTHTLSESRDLDPQSSICSRCGTVSSFKGLEATGVSITFVTLLFIRTSSRVLEIYNRPSNAERHSLH